MSELTFDHLPKAVGEIRAKMDTIEQLLLQLLGKGGATENPNEYVNLDEASKILSLAKQTIYGFTSQRKIPFYKRGKTLYFSRKELTEWIASSRIRTRAEIEKDADNYMANRKRR